MTDSKHLYKEKSPHGIVYYAVSMDFIVICLLVIHTPMHEQNQSQETSLACTWFKNPHMGLYSTQ